MHLHPVARCGIAVAVQCACASLAWSQTAVLPPVVITAARLPQTLDDALPHTTVLSAEEIRASGAWDVPSLLKREAGVEFTQNGGIGSASGLFLRGMESRHVVVLIDGVRVNSETVGATPVEHLPLDQVERIEIVRGNVSALHGSGAIGGVIQIFTRSGAGKLGPHASVMAGSRGSVKLAAGYAAEQAGTGFAVHAAHLRTEGFSAVDTTLFPGDNPDRDGYRNDSVSARLTHRWAPDQQVGVQLMATEGRLDYDNGGNFGLPTDVSKQKSRVSTLAVFSENRLAEHWTAHLQASLGREASRFAANGAFAGRFATRHAQLQWRNRVGLAAGHTLTAGLEADRQSIDSDSGFPPAIARSRTLTSATIGYLAQRGALDVQANLRHDKTPDFGSATTGLVGIGYAFAPRWKLVALMSTAFTAPTLGQLYSPGFGNPALDAERAKSAEAGVSYTAGAAVLRLTAFKTRVRDQIDFDTTAFQYMNLRRVRNAGVELSYAGRVGPVDVRASVTHQDPEDADTGRRLPRRARSVGNLSASMESGRWTWGADLYSSASRPDFGQNLAGYAVLDLRAAYRFNASWSALFKVENATDRDYQTAYGYNQNPRGAFLTLSWQP